MSGRDDFYVGYLPDAPRGLGRWLRRTLLGLLLLVIVVAAVLVTRQSRFGPGVFEFGVERDFTGVVLEIPNPTLLLLDRNTSDRLPQLLLLSALGKRGADELVQGLHGQPAVLRGTLVHRDGRAMIEVHGAEPLAASEAAALSLDPELGVDRGAVTLRGEVVDSKCYLGVMKPGHTKPHRACAVRCISGGVPPMLLVVEPDGSARHLLLASADGKMVNAQVLPWVAEHIEINGRVRAYGDLEVLLADPTTYRRVATE